jgi:predicted kinase
MPNQHPIAHLIYGPTAAGKTTYARKLAAGINGVRFGIDGWMDGLFGADRPAVMDMSWIAPRVVRCQSMIGSTALQVLATGTDVVLELGLLREADRDRAQSMIEAAGHEVSFVFVDADLALRQHRVLQRNLHRGETWSFDVTPSMFDAMETWFERPSVRELLRSKVSTGGSDHGQA